LSVTSRANGLDGYFVHDTSILDGGSALLGTTTVDPAASNAATALDLGGTSFAGSADIISFVITTTAAGAGTAILVPADSTGADTVLSGFQVGDVIVLDPGGEDLVCKVNQISEPAASAEANATATINVHECSANTGTLSPGDQIGERGQISITVTGTAADDIDLQFNVVSEDDNAVLTSLAFTVNIVGADIDVFKFVRNVSSGGNNPSACTAAAFSCTTVGGETYYRAASGQSGVTADPGEILEYAVLMFNNAGLVTDVVVNDTLPLFTAYVDNSAILYAVGIASGAGGTATCDADATIAPCAITSVVTFTSTGADDTTNASGFFFHAAGVIAASAGHDGADGEPTYDSSSIAGGQIDASTTALTDAFQNEVSVIVFQAKVDPQ